MAETKTRPSGESVVEYLAQIEDEQKRRDSQALVKLLTKVTGKKPKMWAGSMIGFGEYHYTYASGHEGDSCLAGFAPRKNELTIYLTGTYFPEQGNARDALLQKLGKHKVGKACLYIKRLSDVDIGVLEDLVRMSVDALRAHYPSK